MSELSDVWLSSVAVFQYQHSNYYRRNNRVGTWAGLLKVTNHGVAEVLL